MYKNFELKRTVELPEIHCTLKELEHLPTGALVIHIENDDPENVFCLSFRTTPEDSTGVAHILEHTVLCGSEKFPVKDPFFSMTRRSLNTFMNAFTGADFTCYPAASQVPKDFYNLLEVYLDAVFKPKLLEFSFLQEGHRLEYSNPDDPASNLAYKGIVFNEMKGAMSSPDARLGEALDKAMYPNITYGVSSGGDPKEIPNLTYQKLLEFHRTYYHPSRCLFFFYGDLPLEKHLDFLEKNALQGVERLPPLPAIPKQKRFVDKVRNIIGYPYSSELDPQDKCLMAFGWLTCGVLEQETVLALTVLTTVLLGTDAAPLKQALLKSGLCKQVLCHLVDDYSEVPVVISLKGCKEEDADKLEQLIFDTLKKIVEEGVPNDLVDSAIHQIEFHRIEITGDHLPYGLNLFMRSGLLRQHGGSPESALLIHTLFEKLRQALIQNPNYYASLITRYFLQNPHMVRVVAKPDRELDAKENEEETTSLRNLQEALSERKKGEFVDLAKRLAAFQEEQSAADIEILPKVTLKDVPEKGRDYPLIQERAGNLEVYRHECFTNQIVYADLIFPLPEIREEELSLLRLFTFLMPQVGCGGRPYDKNLEYIQAHTGGVGAAETTNIQAGDSEAYQPYLLIEGKALYRKADKLFPLLHEMAASLDFTDKARLKEVIGKHFIALQSGLTKNAMKYAINLAGSGLSAPGRIGLAWGGLEYYHFVREIVEKLDTAVGSLSERLEAMKARVLCLSNPHLVLTCSGEMGEKLKKEQYYGLQEISTKPFSPWKNNFSLPEVPPQGRVVATPVAFSSRVLKTVSYTHPDTAALGVAGNLFDNLTLHSRIREQGGAYGGGAMNNALAGNFSFYSYRDPNISSTFAAFDESVEKILQGNFKESDLEEAKLEIIQGLDNPISPGSRGHTAYAWMRGGKTREVRQQFRDRLLKLGRADVIEAVKRHILPKLENAATVVFAGKELLEKENARLQSMGIRGLEIRKI